MTFVGKGKIDERFWIDERFTKIKSIEYNYYQLFFISNSL